MTYSVNYWGSHPDAGNDDCWAGHDFGALADAEKAYACGVPDGYALSADTSHVELSGHNVRRVRGNPAYSPTPDNTDWSNEARMHAALAFGIVGWNDWS